ncbi:unnamed protein product, partial [Didymodactylos carnosus]
NYYGTGDSVIRQSTNDEQHPSTSSGNGHIRPLEKDLSPSIYKDINFQSSTSLLNDYYLLHHQFQQKQENQQINRSKLNSPLKDDISTIKNICSTTYSLNDSLDSNIEIMEINEQECIFEIVDGVLTIVPKDKIESEKQSTSINHVNGEYNLNMEHPNGKQVEDNSKYPFIKVKNKLIERLGGIILTPRKSG